MITTRYFSPETDPRLYTCSETGEQGIQNRLVEALDELRHRCGFPFVITSGYRSPRHSIEAAKTAPGMHAYGLAADIACANGEQKYTIVQQAMEMLIFRGIGVYRGYVHVDLRAKPSMWGV